MGIIATTIIGKCTLQDNILGRKSVVGVVAAPTSFGSCKRNYANLLMVKMLASPIVTWLPFNVQSMC